MRDLATGLVRVLDDDCRAIGPWDPGLEPATLISGLRHMLLVRELDRRMLIAQRQGKASFYMQALGEEAVACGFRAAQRGGDMNFPTYRQQGLLIAADYPIELMMAQVYSNELDPLHGRQMPVMYSAREYGFFSVSGNLATQYVQAVGWAMAAAIKGDDAVAAAWIGDGATAESDFHSAMVFVRHLQPARRAQHRQQPVGDLHLPGSCAWAGCDLCDARPRIRASIAAGRRQRLPRGASRGGMDGRARALGFGPSVVEWVTNRAGAHSSSDDPSGYRPQDEASAWPLGDPIERLREHLVGAGAWSDAEHADSGARGRRAGSRRADRGGVARHVARGAGAVAERTSSKGCTRRCHRTFDVNVNRPGTNDHGADDDDRGDSRCARGGDGT